MLKPLQLLFPVALSLSLAACGGAGSTSNTSSALPAVSNNETAAAAPVTVAPSPQADSTATPAAAPDSVAASTMTTDAVTSTTAGSVVWQAGSATLGHWMKSTTYQCGAPAASGSTFNFHLVRSGTTCGRNQASPTNADGTDSRLTDGRTYTWTFRYVDGTSSGSGPGMGFDRDARSLIFQVHPYGGGNPCTALGFYNGGVTGAAQKWVLSTCRGDVWSGTYTPRETDNWKIVIVPSQTASGNVKLYRNGVLVANVSGSNYSNSGGGSGAPWWNFGPYKWRWEIANGGGSSLTTINAAIEGMTLSVQ